MLVDSHCHLDFPDFAQELDAVIARAEAAGIGCMLTISTHLDKFPGVLAVAERFPQVYCTVGVHPHEADSDWGRDAQKLIDLARHPRYTLASGRPGAQAGVCNAVQVYRHCRRLTIACSSIRPSNAMPSCVRAYKLLCEEQGLPGPQPHACWGCIAQRAAAGSEQGSIPSGGQRPEVNVHRSPGPWPDLAPLSLSLRGGLPI